MNWIMTGRCWGLNIQRFYIVIYWSFANDGFKSPMDEKLTWTVAESTEWNTKQQTHTCTTHTTDTSEGESQRERQIQSVRRSQTGWQRWRGRERLRNTGLSVGCWEKKAVSERGKPATRLFTEHHERCHSRWPFTAAATDHIHQHLLKQSTWKHNTQSPPLTSHRQKDVRGRNQDPSASFTPQPEALSQSHLQQEACRDSEFLTRTLHRLTTPQRDAFIFIESIQNTSVQLDNKSEVHLTVDDKPKVFLFMSHISNYNTTNVEEEMGQFLI